MAELLALIDAAEAALKHGDAQEAFRQLCDAGERVAPDDGAAIVRLAEGLTAAARIVGQQARVLAWFEKMRPVVTDPHARAVLLRTELAIWSRLDTERAQALEREATAAAEAVGDHDGVAIVLALAAFVAYRRGEVRRCRELAEKARALEPISRNAHYQATRAQMFAAIATGELEHALHQTMKARALARDLGLVVDIANESNNLAETYLELGYPHEARACAEMGEKLARDVGVEAIELWARIYGAMATAEAGDIDGAVASLGKLPARDQYPLVMIDGAQAHAYWLLERGAAGDARRARGRAEDGIALAHASGTKHRLTSLHALLARALARESAVDGARDALERARRGADKVEPSAHSHLALAAAEVLAASESPRHVILMNARARILRTAARREDPHAFCAYVRINRRLLELTGGVPTDLPGAS